MSQKPYKLRPEQNKLKCEIQAILKQEKRALLAATTGFGKSVVAWDIIRDYLKQKKRVLVLTHGQTVLRTNFVTSDAKLPRNKFCEFRPGVSVAEANRHNVVIGLPQRIKNYASKFKKFDLVIIDEAHQFYKQSMVQEILIYFSKTKELLMTASHYSFDDIEKVFYSREKAFNKKVISNVEMQLVKIDWNPKKEDFNLQGDLLQKTILARRKFSNFFKIINPKEKSVVVCHNIAAATFIHNHLERHFKDTSVLLSHSKNDPTSVIVDEFKAEASNKILVVVGRANLGFDCKQLETIIDITLSRNIERLEQIFGRVSRKYKKLKKKYVKLIPTQSLEIYKIIMSGVMALGEDNMYRTWDGNHKTIRIPKEYDYEYDYEYEDIDEEEDNILSPKIVTDFERYVGMFKEKQDNEFTTVELALKEVQKKDLAPIKGEWLVKGKYYTYSEESCYEIIRALNIKNFDAWRLGHTGSFSWATKNGLHYTITTKLKWSLRGYSWLIGSNHFIQSEDSCYKIIKLLNIKNSNDWGTKHAASVFWARENNLVIKISMKMKWIIMGYWLVGGKYYSYSEASCCKIIKVLNIKNLTDWEKKHSGSIIWARGMDVHHKIAMKLKWIIRGYWLVRGKYYLYSEDSCYKIIKILNIKSSQEWKIKHKQSFIWVTNTKLYSSIIKNLGWKLNKHQIAKINRT